MLLRKKDKISYFHFSMTLSDKRLELKALRSNKSVFTHCRIGVEGKATNPGGECNVLK